MCSGDKAKRGSGSEETWMLKIPDRDFKNNYD